MEQFNYLIAGLIGLFTLLSIKISLKYANCTIEKFYIIFIAISTFAYSGAGIAFNEVSKKYIFSYLSFIVLLLLGMIIGFRMFKVNKDFKFISSLTGNNRWIINISAFIYWIIILIKLVYPSNRLPYLFNIGINITDVFKNQIASRANILLYIIGIVFILARPLYYIFLYKMKSPIKAALLMALEVYLGVVTSGYIARSGLIVSILMILFVFIFKKYGKKFNYKKNLSEKQKDTIIYKKFIKVFMIIVIILILLLPLLFDFQNLRLQAAASNISASNKVNQLLEIEFGFPKLYGKAEQFSILVTPVSYFKWLFTLPIPKKIFAINNVMLLNYEFTTFLTGIQYGQDGFSVLLPSILGEGIILYGTYLACIHGFIVGLIAGIFCSFFRKSKALSLWNIYILFQLILMPRGGSQGTIATFINGSVLIMICAAIDIFIIKRRIKQ